MTAFRWGLGAALAMLALWESGRVLTVYMDGALWLGVLAVGLLAIMDVAGFVILGLTRWNLHRELLALDQSSPAGSLWLDRKQRLEAMARQGVVPDVQALADASHAQVTGRAYLGRWMVAVPVLVGLGGTFAGIMETLDAVAPMMADEKVSVLTSIAASLGGLHLVFGASIVGIMVTLALSLVHGDLVLAEDMALARLHERTVHVLIPALWPTASSASERMAADVNALRQEIAGVITAMAETAAQKVARIAGAEVDRLVGDVRDSLGRSVEESTRLVRESMQHAVETLDAKLQPVLAEEARLMVETRASLSDVGQEVARAVASAAETAVQGMTQTDSSSRLALEQATERTVHAQERILAGLEQQSALLRASLDEVVSRTERAMREMTEAHVDQMKSATNAVAQPANAAVTRMERASEVMESGVERLLARSSDVQDRLLQSAEERLGKHVDLTRELLAHAGTDVTAAITSAAQSAVQGIANADAATRQVLEQAAERSANAHEGLLKGFTHQAESLRTTLDGLAQRTAEAMQTLTAQHAEALRSSAEAVVGPAQAAVERMERANALMESGMERVLARSSDVQDRLLEAADEKLGRHVEQTRSLLVGAGTEVTAAISAAAESAVQGIARSDAATREALEQASRQAASLHARMLEDSRQQANEMQTAFHGVAERTAGALEQLTRAHMEELRLATSSVVTSAHSAVDRMDRASSLVNEAVERILSRSAESQDRVLATAAEGLAKLSTQLDGAAQESRAALDQTADRMKTELHGTMKAVQQSLFESVEEQGAKLAATTEALRDTVRQTLTDGGDKLRAAADALADAVASLQRGAAELAPSVATLAPELGALAREVALLAARSESVDEQGTVLEEMARLGEGMNRLEALLRMAQGGQ